MASIPITTTAVAMELNRLERQSGSTPTKLGYRLLGGVYEFGQNIVDQFEGDPFSEVKGDLDRLVVQSNSTMAKIGCGAVGAFYGVGSTAFKLPSDVTQGAVAFLADPVTAIEALPASAMHNSQEIASGIADAGDGRISKGTARIVAGISGDWLLFEGARMAVKFAPAAYVEGINDILSRRPTPFNADPFDIAVRSNPEFGGIRIGGAPSYAEVGTGIVKQMQRLGDVKDGIFPAPWNPAKLMREIEVMQEEIGLQRYHFYVGIDFDGVGPAFELSISRLYFKSVDAPLESAVDVRPVSIHRVAVPTMTYAQLRFTAEELKTMPTHEALGVVYNLVPEMATMLEKVAELALAEVN